MLKRNKHPVEELGPAGHKALMENDPFSYQASHKRMVWLMRIIATIAILEAFIIMSGFQLMKNMLPLKEVRVALIRADPDSDKIYSVEPITKTVEGFYVFLEKKSREYVKAILTIDQITQNKRFAEVKLFSEPKFFNQFLDKQEKLIEEAIKDGLNRSIVIESANQVDAYNGVYQYAVDFTRIDQIEDEAPVSRKLRAYLELTTSPQEISENELLSNPHGLQVRDMVVKERTAE